MYWTHNDSGNAPVLFAFREDGTVITPEGVRVEGARNQDWEDLASDGGGTLYVGDIGNNKNARRDLLVYVVDEPDPGGPATVPLLGALPFRFPDQTAFPPAPTNMRFDAEALFCADDTLYLLSKNRSGTESTLYRFAHVDPARGAQTLELLGRHDFKAMVTAADARYGRLAVLTYTGVHICDLAPGRPLAAAPTHRLFLAGQCEGVCFMTRDSVMVTNEAGKVFRRSLLDPPPPAPAP